VGGTLVWMIEEFTVAEEGNERTGRNAGGKTRHERDRRKRNSFTHFQLAVPREADP